MVLHCQASDAFGMKSGFLFCLKVPQGESKSERKPDIGPDYDNIPTFPAPTRRMIDSLPITLRFKLIWFLTVFSHNGKYNEWWISLRVDIFWQFPILSTWKSTKQCYTSKISVSLVIRRKDEEPSLGTEHSFKRMIGWNCQFWHTTVAANTEYKQCI